MWKCIPLILPAFPNSFSFKGSVANLQCYSLHNINLTQSFFGVRIYNTCLVLFIWKQSTYNWDWVWNDIFQLKSTENCNRKTSTLWIYQCKITCVNSSWRRRSANNNCNTNVFMPPRNYLNVYIKKTIHTVASCRWMFIQEKKKHFVACKLIWGSHK